MSDVTICLTNPKSPSNVGAVFRACGCYNINKMLYTGNRYNKAKRHAADTQNIFSKIDIRHVDDFVAERPAGVALICVDFVVGATPLPEFHHPENAFYVFGPEDGSLSQEVIEQADHVVYMPTVGSLNLAAAVNVVLYDRAAKQFTGYDEQLIHSSRDVNNRLKVS